MTRSSSIHDEAVLEAVADVARWRREHTSDAPILLRATAAACQGVLTATLSPDYRAFWRSVERERKTAA